jgi:hypothetical protein
MEGAVACELLLIGRTDSSPRNEVDAEREGSATIYKMRGAQE